jgi:hypothetical protein
MRTLDIGKLGQEREQLTKRIEQLDTLLAAVDAFDGAAPADLSFWQTLQIIFSPRHRLLEPSSA